MAIVEGGWTTSTEAAAMLKHLRLRHPPATRFAADLARLLGLRSLSRQALYDWENGKSRVPAAVLLAACDLAQVTVDSVRGSVRPTRRSG
jgi:transcriptional regulator with XRE-family HTH domain